MENRFLASLSASDLAAIRPLLKPLRLTGRQILFEAGQRINNVYFPTTAIISLVALLSTGDAVEAAMIGQDGMVGGSSTLNGKIAISRALVQVGGDVFAANGAHFKEAAIKSRSLLSKVIRHEQTLFAQAQQSTACMAAHPVEARMARWLLRARDLTGSSRVSVTQDYLAEMLGVRRSGINEVAGRLREAGIISLRRGVIEIVDSAGLMAASCECYDAVKSHYRELVGSQ